ncbi:hypothetical protein Celaphus_00001222 [Cervus elaphus hippelaphus]|uniref:Grh/CP2 DB domain-containing protein n=1 Tax=Cervus elaphus hippelaphus TaxID=46360 RepID=A0A212D8B6_CEREH|nr:hypothetical protein Celaphus_00001222 [Cervus elaphus hippelaphus]
MVRVVFHDQRLQYTEQQQLAGWRWSRPGDRILDIDIPLSVGVLEPQVLPSQLNTVEFYWDPTKRTSLFLQCSPWPEPISGAHPPLSPFALTSPHSCKLLSPERLCSSPLSLDTLGGSLALDLNPGASVPETQQWLHRHRFFSYCRLLANFTGLGSQGPWKVGNEHLCIQLAYSVNRNRMMPTGVMKPFPIILTGFMP